MSRGLLSLRSLPHFRPLRFRSPTGRGRLFGFATSADLRMARQSGSYSGATAAIARPPNAWGRPPRFIRFARKRLVSPS